MISEGWRWCWHPFVSFLDLAWLNDGLNVDYILQWWRWRLSWGRSCVRNNIQILPSKLWHGDWSWSWTRTGNSLGARCLEFVLCDVAITAGINNGERHLPCLRSTRLTDGAFLTPSHGPYSLELA